MAWTRGLGLHVLLVGLILPSCGAFYLPGVAPKSYRNKENVSTALGIGHAVRVVMLPSIWLRVKE